MLDAFIRKRSDVPDKLKADGAQLIVEDAITSALFTPVRFMSPADVFKIVALLAGENDASEPDWTSVQLWPMLDVAPGYRNKRYVEPDVLIDLHYGDHTLRIVIEVKWDAAFGEDQVEMQIASASRDLKVGDKLQHLSIVKYGSSDAQARGKTSLRQWSSILVDLMSAKSRVAHSPRPACFVEWCESAASFLRMQGIGTFNGVDVLQLKDVERVGGFLEYFQWATLKPIQRESESISWR
ncbi:hypothetical protein [Bradyrhizobium sp. Bra64]|uniref:hypothetical protein n=1 Tax=Bradyrhizobium sp. Bra64 TaxID=2926009 RepID=UPI0021180015|nr:hypothetical protein [Bradyrhizobium sp. Bra64]